MSKSAPSSASKHSFICLMPGFPILLVANPETAAIWDVFSAPKGACCTRISETMRESAMKTDITMMTDPRSLKLSMQYPWGHLFLKFVVFSEYDHGDLINPNRLFLRQRFRKEDIIIHQQNCIFFHLLHQFLFKSLVKALIRIDEQEVVVANIKFIKISAEQVSL